MERIPETEKIARVKAEQFINVGSNRMELQHWLDLAGRINRVFQEEPDVAGAVVTHGTATIEETAYFLHRVLAPAKPVVLPAAMRPANALAPDGPQNLLDAVPARPVTHNSGPQLQATTATSACVGVEAGQLLFSMLSWRVRDGVSDFF